MSFALMLIIILFYAFLTNSSLNHTQKGEQTSDPNLIGTTKETQETINKTKD